MLFRIVFILLSIITLQSLANISRSSKEAGNSSVLILKKSNNDLNNTIVNKETLTFKCVAGACEVTAIYYISSQSNHNSKLSFVSPFYRSFLKVSKPKIWVNQNLEKISKTVRVKKNLKYTSKDYHFRHHADESRHDFEARFKRGKNIIKVNYTQFFSFYTASEFGFYPLLSRKYNLYFAYYLYPLKEWNLSPDFNLSIRILFAASKQSSPDSLTTHSKIECLSIYKADGLCTKKKKDQYYCVDFKKPNNIKTIGKFKQVEFSYNNKFPDTLECHLGQKASKRRVRKRIRLNW